MRDEAWEKYWRELKLGTRVKLEHQDSQNRIIFPYLAANNGVAADPMCGKYKFDDGNCPSGTRLALTREELGLTVPILMFDEDMRAVGSMNRGLPWADIHDIKVRPGVFPLTMRDITEFMVEHKHESLFITLDPNAPSNVTLDEIAALFVRTSFDITVRFTTMPGVLLMKTHKACRRRFLGSDELDDLDELVRVNFYKLHGIIANRFLDMGLAVSWTGHYGHKCREKFDSFIIGFNEELINGFNKSQLIVTDNMTKDLVAVGSPVEYTAGGWSSR